MKVSLSQKLQNSKTLRITEKRAQEASFYDVGGDTPSHQGLSTRTHFCPVLSPPISFQFKIYPKRTFLDDWENGVSRQIWGGN